MAVIAKWNRSEVSFGRCDFWAHGPFALDKKGGDANALIWFQNIVSSGRADKKMAHGLNGPTKFNFMSRVLELYGFIYLFCKERMQIRCSWACFCYSCVCVPFDLIRRLLPPASAEKDWYSRRMNMYVICTLTWTCFWPSSRKLYTYTHMSRQHLENDVAMHWSVLSIKLRNAISFVRSCLFVCLHVVNSMCFSPLMAIIGKNVMAKCNVNYCQN